jgi:hypothetical protein
VPVANHAPTWLWHKFFGILWCLKESPQDLLIYLGVFPVWWEFLEKDNSYLGPKTVFSKPVDLGLKDWVFFTQCHPPSILLWLQQAWLTSRFDSHISGVNSACRVTERLMGELVPQNHFSNHFLQHHFWGLWEHQAVTKVRVMVPLCDGRKGKGRTNEQDGQTWLKTWFQLCIDIFFLKWRNIMQHL